MTSLARETKVYLGADSRLKLADVVLLVFPIFEMLRGDGHASHTIVRTPTRARARASSKTRARRCGYAIRLRKAGKPPASLHRFPFGRDRQMLRRSFRPSPALLSAYEPHAGRKGKSPRCRSERHRETNRALRAAETAGDLNFYLEA